MCDTRGAPSSHPGQSTGLSAALLAPSHKERLTFQARAVTSTQPELSPCTCWLESCRGWMRETSSPRGSSPPLCTPDDDASVWQWQGTSLHWDQHNEMKAAASPRWHWAPTGGARTICSVFAAATLPCSRPATSRAGGGDARDGEVDMSQSHRRPQPPWLGPPAASSWLSPT